MMWSLLTKHCFLRDYGDEDREAFIKLNTHASARDHMGGALSEPEAEKLFRSTLQDTDPRQGLRWAVFERKSNEYLGHIFFIPWESKFEMEMGIIMQPDHTGKGLEEELGLACLEHLFEEKPVQKVISTVGVEHASCIKLLKTLGMECVERCQDDSGYYYVYELTNKRFGNRSLALQAS